MFSYLTPTRLTFQDKTKQKCLNLTLNTKDKNSIFHLLTHKCIVQIYFEYILLVYLHCFIVSKDTKKFYFVSQNLFNYLFVCFTHLKIIILNTNLKIICFYFYRKQLSWHIRKLTILSLSLSKSYEYVYKIKKHSCVGTKKKPVHLQLCLLFFLNHFFTIKIKL